MVNKPIFLNKYPSSPTIDNRNLNLFDDITSGHYDIGLIKVFIKMKDSIIKRVGFISIYDIFKF